MANIRIFDQLLVNFKFPGNSRDFPGKHFISREAKNTRDPGRETLGETLALHSAETVSRAYKNHDDRMTRYE